MTSRSNHVVTATIKTTGEVLEYNYSDKNDLATAYQDVVAHLEAYQSLKRLLLETSMHLLIQSTEQDKDVTK